MSDEINVWAVPILSSTLTPSGYSQVELRCTCGYRRIMIAQLAGTYGRWHYERHGLTPRLIEIGWNGADETVHDIVRWD